MILEQNVGGADKVIRIVVGIVLIAFAVFSDVDVAWKIVAWVGAAIALLTAVVGFCPLNRLLGINTCRHRL